jgi:hypothetical protein
VPPSKDRLRSSPIGDLGQGLKFIKGNVVFSFLIGMTFFNSFFGMAYIAASHNWWKFDIAISYSPSAISVNPFKQPVLPLRIPV